MMKMVSFISERKIVWWQEVKTLRRKLLSGYQIDLLDSSRSSEKTLMEHFTNLCRSCPGSCYFLFQSQYRFDLRESPTNSPVWPGTCQNPLALASRFWRLMLVSEVVLRIHVFPFEKLFMIVRCLMEQFTFLELTYMSSVLKDISHQCAVYLLYHFCVLYYLKMSYLG